MFDYLISNDNIHVEAKMMNNFNLSYIFAILIHFKIFRSEACQVVVLCAVSH